MPEHCVAIQLERIRQSDNIPGAVLQGAGFGSHLVGEAVAPLVDEDQAKLIGE
jgi:hypothetical protein